MATIDSSIYFQQPQSNIGDAVIKGINLASALQQRKMAAQEYQKQQGLQAAAKDAVITNPDGTTTFDQKKFNSLATAIDPLQAHQLNQQFQNDDYQNKINQLKLHKEQLDGTLGYIRGSTDQASYTANRNLAIQNGLSTPQELPEAYDPNFLKALESRVLGTKDSVELELKRHGQDIEQQKATASAKMAQAKMAEVSGNRQGQAMQQTIQLLESGRGNPAVQQAQKDLYAAQKVNSLINLYGNPDNLNPQMVKLVASEVAKIAQGGVPQMQELKDLTPSSIPSRLAGIAQEFTNTPTAANAGAFLKQFQDYSNTLQADAKKVVRDKLGRVIESKRKYIGDDNYKTLRANYLDQFDQSNAGGSKDYHAMSDDELDKAYKAAGGK